MKLKALLPPRPHGESGWVGRVLASGVAIAVLSTARPADSWVWVVLGMSFALFLAGSVLMTARPYVSFALLSVATISSALIAGYPQSNALVLVLVAITDIAVNDKLPRRLTVEGDAKLSGPFGRIFRPRRPALH